MISAASSSVSRPFVDGLVEVGLGLGDQGVDHGLHVDVVGLGHLGDASSRHARAVAELLALDADGLGGGVEARRRSGRDRRATGTAAVGQALALDHLGHAVGQLVDGGLEALGGGRDHGVDHGLHVDVVGLGDLGDRLAVLEGGAQLVLGDADRLGGDGELTRRGGRGGSPPPRRRCRRSVVSSVPILGEGEVRGPEDRTGCPAAREGEGEGGGPQELAVHGHVGRSLFGG